MIEKYRPNFESLTQEEAVHVAHAIVRRLPDLPVSLPEPESITPEGVYWMCESCGIDQADVVLSMSRDATALGVSCLEKLVGHPIKRPDDNPKRKTTGRQQQKPKKPRPELRDDRVIRVVAESNPKKAGTKAHEKFELYEDGMTVSAYLRLGGTSAEIKWDAERDFIRVEDPE